MPTYDTHHRLPFSRLTCANAATEEQVRRARTEDEAVNMNLTAGMVTVAGGVATLSSAGATTLTATDDPMVCGPWAITRWLRVLDVVMTQPSHRIPSRQIDDADPVTDRSPHLCRSNR